jgi:hypothetical protein
MIPGSRVELGTVIPTCVSEYGSWRERYGTYTVESVHGTCGYRTYLPTRTSAIKVVHSIAYMGAMWRFLLARGPGSSEYKQQIFMHLTFIHSFEFEQLQFLQAFCLAFLWFLLAP